MHRSSLRQGYGRQACAQCRASFDVTESDIAMLEKLSPTIGGKRELIPPPTLCPDCREQRRLLWRNERSLYRRTCDLCKKSIIAMYSSDKPFPVYCPDCWWGDKWDPFSFGWEFDFSRPFFAQFRELQVKVPRLSLNVLSNENSEYVNLGAYNKNCYLVFAMEYNEDCMYGTELIKCTGCVDTLNCFESEYCFEVTDVEKCHTLFFSRDCSNCTNSFFLSDCRNCHDCLLSTGLRGKRHCVRNTQVSKEKFEEERITLLQRLAHGELPAVQEELNALDRSRIHRAASLINCENVTGDYLKNSRNLHHCFDVSYGEDCSYVSTGFKVKDLMDVCHTTEGELSYEALSLGYGSYGVMATHGSWTSKNVLYCDTAQSCNDLFGCVGMKRARYCILNKQYSKEEYEKLIAKIISSMRTAKEYGEFFPASCAPFAYNETTALQYFPVTKEEAEKRGFTWHEENDALPDVSKVIPADQLPSSIDDIPDDILNWAIECETTKRPFKIIKQELKFYRTMRLPVPRFHPDERHRRRMGQRNPRRLWERRCDNCKKTIVTTFAPERSETVYCESCYLSTVY